MRASFASRGGWARKPRQGRCSFRPWSVFALSPLLLVAAGCASFQPTAAAEPKAPAGAAMPGDMPAVQRLQQEEGPVQQASVRSLLDRGLRQFHEDDRGQVTVRIRAQVNGTPILDDEVRQAARFGNVDEDTALQQLIDREVIYSDAMARIEKLRPQFLEKLKEAAGKEADRQLRFIKTQIKATSDEELKAMLRAQGITLESFRRRVERQFIAQEYMRSRIFPNIERISLQQIKDYYEEHPSEFQVEDRVKWQDIFIDASRYPSRAAARKVAEQVVARARAGEDFAQLCRQYDNGYSSYRNGEGYGQRRGEIKPQEAEPLLFRMSKGEIGPIIELTSGFHVIRLVDRQQAGLKPCDEETQNEIRKKMQNALADREWKRILTELKRKSTIEIAAGAER